MAGLCCDGAVGDESNPLVETDRLRVGRDLDARDFSRASSRNDVGHEPPADPVAHGVWLDEQPIKLLHTVCSGQHEREAQPATFTGRHTNASIAHCCCGHLNHLGMGKDEGAICFPDETRPQLQLFKCRDLFGISGVDRLDNHRTQRTTR